MSEVPRQETENRLEEQDKDVNKFDRADKEDVETVPTRSTLRKQEMSNQPIITRRFSTRRFLITKFQLITLVVKNG